MESGGAEDPGEAHDPPHPHGPQGPPAQLQPVPESRCAAEARSPHPCAMSPVSSPAPSPVQTPGDRSTYLVLLAQLGHTWTCAPSLLTAAPRTAAGRTGHAGQHLRLENLLF